MTSSCLVVSVGLVDSDEVGEFQNAFLDALQLVTGSWKHEHDEHVDHLCDNGFALANADCLDQNHVVAGSLDNRGRLSGTA